MAIIFKRRTVEYLSSKVGQNYGVSFIGMIHNKRYFRGMNSTKDNLFYEFVKKNCESPSIPDRSLPRH